MEFGLPTSSFASFIGWFFISLFPKTKKCNCVENWWIYFIPWNFQVSSRWLWYNIYTRWSNSFYFKTFYHVLGLISVIYLIRAFGYQVIG